MTKTAMIPLRRAPLLRSVGLGATLLLSACAVAPPMTQQEVAVSEQVAVEQYMPAGREMRDNIETQELFAQAAFWSHEYDLNPSDLEAAIKLASSVRRLGNPSRAVEITQTTRAIHPRDPYLLAEHAAGLIADERALDAVPILDQGLRIAPQYARMWSLKGAALDQLEDYPQARRHYARALQITPDDPNILANVGLSHALSGDPATAEGWLRRAVALPGAGAGVRQNLALVLQLQGKTQESERLTRVASQSRGDRRLPPPPVPAQPLRMDGAPQAASGPQRARGPARGPARSQATRRAPQTGAQPPAQGGYASSPQADMPAMGFNRSGYPATRLTTTAPSGQQFASASDAARAAAAQRRANASAAPQPLPTVSDMDAQQRDVLSQISRSIGPQATAPRSAQQPQQQPHVVGPALRGPSPSQPGYGTQGYPASPRGHAGTSDPRRGAARRRR